MTKNLTFRLLQCLFMLTLMLMNSLTSSAAVVRKVWDPWTTEAVTKNMALVEVVEKEHNTVLDTIKARQQKIAKYTATMESIKELYRMSMQNVRGFGEETAYYKEIIHQLTKIPVNTVKATKAIMHSPGINYINCLNEIANLQLKAVSLVKLYTDVVNNGKVSLSDFTSGKGDKLSALLKGANLGKGDGYNFIDRYTRLALCMRLIGGLSDINYSLEMMIYICDYCSTLENLVQSLDPDTWVSYLTTKSIAKGIISDWNYEMGGSL